MSATSFWLFLTALAKSYLWLFFPYTAASQKQEYLKLQTLHFTEEPESGSVNHGSFTDSRLLKSVWCFHTTHKKNLSLYSSKVEKFNTNRQSFNSGKKKKKKRIICIFLTNSNIQWFALFLAAWKTEDCYQDKISFYSAWNREEFLDEALWNKAVCYLHSAKHLTMNQLLF